MKSMACLKVKDSPRGERGSGLTWMEWLGDLFFPPRCLLCGQVVETGRKLCTRCHEKYRLSPEKQEFTLGTITVISLFRDSEESRRGVNKAKFQGDSKTLEYFGLEMAKMLRDCCPDPLFDGVTFVPMPTERQKNRGYNQAEVLARVVARELGVPLISNLLEKQDILTQHNLSGSMRRKRGSGCRLIPGVRLQGERLLLVDDICTTGTTLQECGLLLRQAGASEVAGIVLLRRQKDKEF